MTGVNYIVDVGVAIHFGYHNESDKKLLHTIMVRNKKQKKNNVRTSLLKKCLVPNTCVSFRGHNVTVFVTSKR